MPEDQLAQLLADLCEHGAEELQRLYERHGALCIEKALESGYLAWVPTPLGELILLGPQGRRTLNLSPFYKSPPEAAATQLVQRRVKEELEAQDWLCQGKFARNLLSFVTNEGKMAFVLARYRDYTARSVRRVLDKHKGRLISESAVLVVATRYPYRLRKLVEKHPSLLTTRHLKY